MLSEGPVCERKIIAQIKAASKSSGVPLVDDKDEIHYKHYMELEGYVNLKDSTKYRTGRRNDF